MVISLPSVQEETLILTVSGVIAALLKRIMQHIVVRIRVSRVSERIKTY